jgi:hypothetical protein
MPWCFFVFVSSSSPAGESPVRVAARRPGSRLAASGRNGWAAYFKYGHSARRLSKIRQYAWTRLALFVSKKHRRSRHFGRQVMLRASPRDLGLVSLYGITVAPRAGKPWREKPNAGGERRR